jgi:hypothetical protein
MIEVASHPVSPIGAVMLHSTESGGFLSCTRHEFERLAAAIVRGDLDQFLTMAESSAVADGSPDWTAARSARDATDEARATRQHMTRWADGQDTHQGERS